MNNSDTPRTPNLEAATAGVASFHEDPLVTLFLGDCLGIMAELPDASVDAVVTDPPYGLEFMGKSWDKLGDTSGSLSREKVPLPHFRAKNIGMAAQRFHEQWAREVFRLLKPGGHLLAFGGTRTYHRLASAIEDAGFEIRDQLGWIYASGFPKSLDVSKAMDKAAGAEREVVGRHVQSVQDRKRMDTEDVQARIGGANGLNWQHDLTAPATDLARKWQGWGTALKPAWEPIVLARKPLIGSVARNVSEFGTGALNIDGTRIAAGDGITTARKRAPVDGAAPFGKGYEMGGDGSPLGRWPSNILLSDPELFDQPNPWVVGSGATSVSGSRTGEYDGSGSWSGPYGGVDQPIQGSVGGYSRFFLVPKADRAERERGLGDRPQEDGGAYAGGKGMPGRTLVNGEWQQTGTWQEPNRKARANVHPTVKPIDLMRHLVRLVTPPGGVVLDPFLGSGTTALAASEEGFRCIGIERELEYLEISKGRLMATPMGLGLDVPAPTRKRTVMSEAESAERVKSYKGHATFKGGWAWENDPEEAA